MKTIILSLAIAVISVSGYAKTNNFRYIITSTDTIFCSKIGNGLFSTKYTLVTGEKNKISNKEINQIYNNGKTYAKKPVYIDNINTGKKMMMELVYCKNRIKIFRYSNFTAFDGEDKLMFSFFKDDQYLKTLQNPNVADINAYLDRISEDKDQLLTEK